MPSRAVERALPALAVLAALLACAAVGCVARGVPPAALVALACQLPVIGCLGLSARAARGGPTAESCATALSAATSDAVLLDDAGRITFAGRGSADLLGIASQRLVGRRLEEFVHTEDAGDTRQRIAAIATATAGTSSRWQVRGLEDDGDHPLWLELTTRALDAEEPGILVLLRDASAGEELDPDARDELTGLTTRTEFFRRASRATAAAHPQSQVAILFCDLDGFDGVNAVYGRPAGDEVLRSVGARLRRALRPHELIGRIGGDEFGVLLPAPVEPENAQVVADRLQAAVATAITLRAGDAVQVPMNIVVAIVDTPTAHAESVVPQSNRTASKTLTPLT